MKTFKSIITLMALVLLFVSGTLQQNFDFADALSVNPADSISLDNSASPDDAVLSLCSELSSATSFLWYKIDSSSSLRIFTVDTCDVDFDSVIGVFSGSDFSSLETLGCNDDRTSGTDSCDPSSSLIQNISVPSGETLYIVIGSFVDPYTGLPSLGTGHLLITEVDPSSLECSADLILQVQQDLELDLSNLQSTVTSAITTSQNQVASDITDAQTAIIAAVDDAESALDADIQGVQTTANSIQSTVTSTSSTVTSISSLLSTVDGKVDNVGSDLADVNTNVNALGSQIDTLSSQTSTKFTDTNTNIDDVQTAADQIIVLANQLLGDSADIQTSNDDIADQITSFESDVTASFSTINDDIDTLNSKIDLSNAKLVTLNDDLDNIDQSVSSVSSKITTLTGNTNTMFTNTNANIDDLQTTADQVESLVNQVLGDAADIQAQQTALISQLNNFESSVSDSFGSALDALTTVSSAVASVDQTSQSSFSDTADLLTALQTSSNSIHSDSTASLNLLNSMRSNVNSDTNQNVFVDTLIRYLPDKSVANPPLFIRIPNVYGGRLNDAAAYVISQYTSLKISALAVGVKGSAECNASAFCNFFLGTADAAYSDSIVKFNTYMNSRKFSIAYTYLQQAFINLFPSTW